MQAYYQIWRSALDEDYSFFPVATRLCTPEDFGITNTSNPNPKFFSPLQQNIPAFESMLSNLHCIDENITIFGDWNSLSAKNLILTFEKCDQEVNRTCKNDT